MYIDACQKGGVSNDCSPGNWLEIGRIELEKIKFMDRTMVELEENNQTVNNEYKGTVSLKEFIIYKTGVTP